MQLWHDNLSLGIQSIDDQHKDLLFRMELLARTLNPKGSNKQQFDDMLQFLHEYVDRHFKDEEQLMEKASYPGYDEHKAMHDAFIQSLDNLNGC